MNYIIFEYCHIKHPHIRPQFLLKPFSLKHHLNISKHPPLWRLFLKKTCTVHPRQNPRWSGSFPQRGEWVISLGIVETLRRSEIFETRQGRTSQGGFESQWYLRLESFILCQKVLFCEAKLMLFFCLCFLFKQKVSGRCFGKYDHPIFVFEIYYLCCSCKKHCWFWHSWSFSPSSQPIFFSKGGDHCKFAHCLIIIWLTGLHTSKILKKLGSCGLSLQSGIRSNASREWHVMKNGMPLVRPGGSSEMHKGWLFLESPCNFKLFKLGTFCTMQWHHTFFHFRMKWSDWPTTPKRWKPSFKFPRIFVSFVNHNSGSQL